MQCYHPVECKITFPTIHIQLCTLEGSLKAETHEPNHSSISCKPNVCKCGWGVRIIREQYADSSSRTRICRTFARTQRDIRAQWGWVSHKRTSPTVSRQAMGNTVCLIGNSENSNTPWYGGPCFCFYQRYL